jgi:hypothetical protein
MLSSLNRAVASSGTLQQVRHAFTEATINPNVLAAQYAVRGALVQRAEVLEAKLKADKSSVPFKEIIYCNIGNPQQLQQKPLTFLRQVREKKTEKKNSTKKIFHSGSEHC